MVTVAGWLAGWWGVGWVAGWLAEWLVGCVGWGGVGWGGVAWSGVGWAGWALGTGLLRLGEPADGSRGNPGGRVGLLCHQETEQEPFKVNPVREKQKNDYRSSFGHVL